MKRIESPGFIGTYHHISEHSTTATRPTSHSPPANMSLRWSAPELFGFEFKRDDNARIFVYCQMTKQGGAPCTNKILLCNVQSMRNASNQISRQPIDEVSSHSIEGLAQFSVCFTHRDKTHTVAEKWKRMVAEKIKLEWKRSRAQVATLQAENVSLEKDLGAEKIALAAALGSVSVLKEELEKAQVLLEARNSKVEEVKPGLVEAQRGVLQRWFGA